MMIKVRSHQEAQAVNSDLVLEEDSASSCEELKARLRGEQEPSKSRCKVAL